MSVKQSDLTYCDNRQWSGVYNFEVFGPAGFYINTDATSARQAKRVALRMINDGLTLAEAEDKEL
jgi:hypothetical protein